jgi:hypothetical protein
MRFPATRVVLTRDSRTALDTARSFTEKYYSSLSPAEKDRFLSINGDDLTQNSEVRKSLDTWRILGVDAFSNALTAEQRQTVMTAGHVREELIRDVLNRTKSERESAFGFSVPSRCFQLALKSIADWIRHCPRRRS